MVISQGNYDDVENFCNLAISLGFTPELAFIYKSGNGCDDWNTKELTSIQKLKILKLAEHINKEKMQIYFFLCVPPNARWRKDLTIFLSV